MFIQPPLALRAIQMVLTNMLCRLLYIVLILPLSASMCFSQNQTKTMEGKVTFITSNNVYVRFETTQSITIGDTLFTLNNALMTPCLIVKEKSSTSSVAMKIGECNVKVGDQLIHKYKFTPIENAPEVSDKISVEKARSNKQPKEKIRGNISAASYSTFSANRGDNTRVMYRLSLNANHINNSKFSVETYANYRQTFVSKDNQSASPDHVLNLYSLALQYDVSPSMSLVIGRKINGKVSSIGAIDGLQVEKSFGNFYTGVIAGFRPDILDYTFNSDLLQYGAFVGLNNNTESIYAQTTLGVLEQTNSGNTDRRYVYFQHSSTLIGKVTVFSSVELDLYNQVTGDSTGDPRWTNIYLSATYRLNRKIDLGASYNSRKQIVYYETFKTEIERMLDDDIAKQGARFSVNFRPSKFIHMGGAYSKRFQSNDLNKSDNVNANLGFSKIPRLGGRLYINYNRNTSSYMKTDIISFRHSRSLIEMKLDADFYYRMVNYTYFISELITKQKYYGVSLAYRMPKKIMISVEGELVSIPNETNYRVNARICKTL